MKTNKVLIVGILISFIICFACNSNDKNNDIGRFESVNQNIGKTENTNSAATSNDEKHEVNIQRTNQHADEIEGGNDTTILLNSLDDLYEALYTFSLPLSLSQILFYDSTKSTKVPKSLISAFLFLTDSYDKDVAVPSVAKLPEYRNIKIIILRAYMMNGQDVLFLCTFLNNTIIDWLQIYSVGDWEYDGSMGMVETSFSITNNYEISIKTAHYPTPEDERYVTQVMYIISDDGKFIKK